MLLLLLSLHVSVLCVHVQLVARCPQVHGGEYLLRNTKLRVIKLH